MKDFLNGFWSVFKRELYGYFTTPLLYVFLVIFLAAVSVATFKLGGFFRSNQASLQLFFNYVPMVLILLVPALAMRLWAEERKSNSVMLLFTLPITTTQAVLGKYLAALAVLTTALLLTFPAVVTVVRLGDPDGGPIVCGYLGSFLLAAAFLAISSFFSAATRSQVIAFILSVVAIGLLFLIGYSSVLVMISDLLVIVGNWCGGPESGLGGFVAGLSKVLIDILESLSFQLRFNSMQRGVLELRDLLFFIVCTGGCLWANLVLLEQRRAAR